MHNHEFAVVASSLNQASTTTGPVQRMASSHATPPVIDEFSFLLARNHNTFFREAHDRRSHVQHTKVRIGPYRLGRTLGIGSFSKVKRTSKNYIESLVSHSLFRARSCCSRANWTQSGCQDSKSQETQENGHGRESPHGDRDPAHVQPPAHHPPVRGHRHADGYFYHHGIRAGRRAL
jgi:hypothetical protein